jgi:hypothetical protein
VPCYIGEDTVGKSLSISPLCPQNALKLTTKKAKGAGLDLLLGLETEFTVLWKDDDGNLESMGGKLHQACSMRSFEGVMTL